MSKNYCALVEHGKVVAIIVAEYEWTEANLEGDWHDLGEEPLEVAIDWTFDKVSNSFSPPPIVESPIVG